jgi:hypothetical protein
MKIKELDVDTYEIRSSELYINDDKALLEYFNNIKVNIEVLGNGLSSILIQRNKRFNFSSVDKIIIKKKKIIKINSILDIDKMEEKYFEKNYI